MHAALLPELPRLCNGAGKRGERAASPATQHRLWPRRQGVCDSTAFPSLEQRNTPPPRAGHPRRALKACFQRRVALVLPDLKRAQASTRYLTRPLCPGGGASLDDVAVFGRSSVVFVSFSVGKEEITSSLNFAQLFKIQLYAKR